jgi:predicted transcriptional regulator
MRAKGMSQTEIARELQVSEASISLDMQYLRSQAKEYIKEYVTEHLPEQYQICLTALDAIIKRAFDILENSADNREKLQAMELFKDAHLVKLELLSNATTIDGALDYIRNKQQEQQQQKHLSLDSASDDNNNDSDSQLTTAGRQTVFR